MRCEECKGMGITNEMIEDAASEHACAEYDPAASWRWEGDLWTQASDSFKLGAKWAIEQLTK